MALGPHRSLTHYCFLANIIFLLKSDYQRQQFHSFCCYYRECGWMLSLRQALLSWFLLVLQRAANGSFDQIDSSIMFGRGHSITAIFGQFSGSAFENRLPDFPWGEEGGREWANGFRHQDSCVQNHLGEGCVSQPLQVKWEIKERWKPGH